MAFREPLNQQTVGYGQMMEQPIIQEQPQIVQPQPHKGIDWNESDIEFLKEMVQEKRDWETAKRLERKGLISINKPMHQPPQVILYEDDKKETPFKDFMVGAISLGLIGMFLRIMIALAGG